MKNKLERKGNGTNYEQGLQKFWSVIEHDDPQFSYSKSNKQIKRKDLLKQYRLFGILMTTPNASKANKCLRTRRE